MMGGGFTGQMDPRQIMMQMQMARQGMQRPGGGPMAPQAGGMPSAGMRSPNAPMPAAPAPQQQQNPMQGMQMQMLMEALKKRQATPPGQPQPAVAQGSMTPQQAEGMGLPSPAAGGAGGGLMGWLSTLFA